MKEWVVDRWLTWRTGKPKAQRDYEAWYRSTVNSRANTVQDMYNNFKYLIQVDYYKFYIEHMFVEPIEEVRQYRYPHRALGDNMVYGIYRGYDFYGEFIISDFGDTEDRVYVATNNHEDAVMLALKYA